MSQGQNLHNEIQDFAQDFRPPRTNYFQVAATKMQRDLQLPESLDAQQPQEPPLSREDGHTELPLKAMSPASRSMSQDQPLSREDVRSALPLGSLPMNPSQGFFRPAPQKHHHMVGLDGGQVFPIDVSPEGEVTSLGPAPGRSLGLPSLQYSSPVKHQTPPKLVAEQSDGSQQQEGGSLWRLGALVSTDMCKSENPNVHDSSGEDGMCKSSDGRSHQVGINYKEGERPSAEMLFTGGSGSQVLVGYVAPGSKAQRAGVIEGCALLAINETASGVFNHLPGWHVRMMLRAPCWLYFEKKTARPQGPSEIRVKNLRDVSVGLSMSHPVTDPADPGQLAEQAVFQTHKGPLWLQVMVDDDNREKADAGGNEGMKNLMKAPQANRSRNHSPVYEVRRRDAQELIANALRPFGDRSRAASPVQNHSLGAGRVVREVDIEGRPIVCDDFLRRENTNPQAMSMDPCDRHAASRPGSKSSIRWSSPPVDRGYNFGVTSPSGLGGRPRQTSPRPGQARGDVGVQRLVSGSGDLGSDTSEFPEKPDSSKNDKPQEQGDEGSLRELTPMSSTVKEAPVRIFPRSPPTLVNTTSNTPREFGHGRGPPVMLSRPMGQSQVSCSRVRLNSPVARRPAGDTEVSPEEIMDVSDAADSNRNEQTMQKSGLYLETVSDAADSNRKQQKSEDTDYITTV
mmetsp:Transcript_37749/g.69889  ORF Transcript_37749/g.69889 Transcript_37749/m.69889 type:complete len:681 (+) Transcript_37749:120-2162(+)